jgi:hypothetical protein
MHVFASRTPDEARAACQNPRQSGDHMTWNRAISQFSTAYVENSLPLPH